MLLFDRFQNVRGNKLLWPTVCGKNRLCAGAVFGLDQDRPALLVTDGVAKIHDHDANLSFGSRFNLLHPFLQVVVKSLPEEEGSGLAITHLPYLLRIVRTYELKAREPFIPLTLDCHLPRQLSRPQSD